MEGEPTEHDRWSDVDDWDEVDASDDLLDFFLASQPRLEELLDAEKPLNGHQMLSWQRLAAEMKQKTEETAPLRESALKNQFQRDLEDFEFQRQQRRQQLELDERGYGLGTEPQPCQYPAGSESKVDEMKERVAKGLRPTSAQDAPPDPEDVDKIISVARNGAVQKSSLKKKRAQPCPQPNPRPSLNPD
jgi:hypothetical protein